MSSQPSHQSDFQVSDGPDLAVSGRLMVPAAARVCFVFAHGAGAGMAHPFMQAVATGLAARRIATLRYQFPFMERGSKRPDPPSLAHRTVRAAVAAAHAATGLPLVAGGKSFGGRMTSQTQAEAPLDGVIGLIFLGFPLHPPGRPSSERAAHLPAVSVPMLFLQGTRDKLAEFPRIEAVISTLPPATLLPIEHADHGFEVLVRSGRRPDEVMTELIEGVARWVAALETPRAR